MKKRRSVIGVVVMASLALGALAIFVQWGIDHYGWTRPIPKVATAQDIPDHVSVAGESWQPAEFPAECGDDTRDAVRQGYGIVSVERAAREAEWIVEGTVRSDGPARWGGEAWTGNLTREESAQSLHQLFTPFRIEVTRVHRGSITSPDGNLGVRAEGGKIGCISVREDAESVTLFDGAEGLFFIASSGYAMYAVVTGEPPGWYADYYTDSAISAIEALAMTGSSR